MDASLRIAMNRNLIITGIPRSGSTLTCSLLDRLPDVVALNETMNVGGLLALPDADSRVQAISDYFAETRRTIDRTGRVPRLRVAGSEGNMFLSEDFNRAPVRQARQCLGRRRQGAADRLLAGPEALERLCRPIAGTAASF